MKLYIANAFSLSMLDREQQAGTPSGYTPRAGEPIAKVARIPRPVDAPAEMVSSWEDAGAEIVSVVGHADTARVLGGILGRELAANRVSIRLARYEHVLVGQLMGSRLPEGATELPEGATIEWWIV